VLAAGVFFKVIKSFGVGRGVSGILFRNDSIPAALYHFHHHYYSCSNGCEVRVVAVARGGRILLLFSSSMSEQDPLKLS